MIFMTRQISVKFPFSTDMTCLVNVLQIQFAVSYQTVLVSETDSNCSVATGPLENYVMHYTFFARSA